MRDLRGVRAGSTVAERVRDGVPPVGSRLLDVVVAIALAFCVGGIVVGWRHGLGQGLVGTVTLVAGGLLAVVARRRLSLWAALGSTAATTTNVVATLTGEFTIFLLLVDVVLVALTGGLGIALACVAVVCLAGVGQLVVIGQGPVDVARQTIGMGAFLAVAACLGALLRGLAEARATANRRRRELELANEQLRAAMATERDLVLAQERARAAAELHDGLGHRLTLVAMSLQFAQRARERDPERAWAEIATAATGTRDALDHMRLWVRALDPPVAGPDLGGAHAFDAIADAFRGTGLDVGVSHQGSQRPLPREAALLATRLVQEGLTNVLRHAHATRVDVGVEQSAQRLRIVLRDDGATTAEAPEGFGLRSLRERAEALGGSLRCGALAGGGWELAAELPLSEGD